MKTFRLQLTAAFVASAPIMTFAGVLRPDILVQTYRDFAENRGVFKAGATNVTVYNKDGTVNGVIERMPDFSATNDGGYVTMFNPSFGGSVNHVSYTTAPTFTQRFNDTGLADSLFGDTYREVKSLTPSSGFDYKIMRYSKIFIDAAPTPLATSSSTYNNIVGKQIIRVGGGLQEVASGQGIATDPYPTNGDYGWLTGGTNIIRSVSVSSTNLTLNGTTTSHQTISLYFGIDSTSDSPLEIGTLGGDSGSPVYVWNSTNQRFEIIAFNQAGTGETTGFGKDSIIRAAPSWTVAQVNSYNSPAVVDAQGAGVISVGTTNASGAGTFTQGSTSWNFQGLGSGKTFATATNDELDATKNVTFNGAGNTIRLTGNVDLGAGSMTFKNGGTYTLDDGGNSNFRLNSAGYIVEGTTSVVSQLTGSAGDDWRKLGTGTLRIEGSGNSNAKLSLGEGLVVLNRSGGYAVDDVLITSGRGTVRMEGANQINGDVSFGRNGGTLDLYGNHFSRSVIYAMDSGAKISNTKANTTSTLTWTGSGSAAEQTFRGGFADGGNTANGLLRVVINPTTAAGSILTLRGNSTNQGGYQINGGEVVLRGFNTPHAGADGVAAVDNVFPDDWTYASIKTGSIAVASGAKFTLADHARLDGNVNVSNGGTFAITENLFKSNAESVEGALAGTPSSALYGHQSGSVALNGTNAAMIATISSATDQKATYSRNISGTGSFTKNGSGSLTLSGNNTFSGVKTHNGGDLIGTSLAALGDTTTNKWNLTATNAVIAAQGATYQQISSALAANATGTMALGSSEGDIAINLANSPNLFLGAIGNQSIGTQNTTTTLAAWNNGGWNLGGGGGTLTVNHKLSGAGTLNIGNGVNQGTVILTNANNSTTNGGDAFTGQIKIQQGVKLEFTDAAALGTGGRRIGVVYGSQLSLGDAPSTLMNAVTTDSAGVLTLRGNQSNAISLASPGLNNVALGASGAATLSGALTAGSNGYKFGGDGALTVQSDLSGNRNVSLDGQGTQGGVTTLAGNNTFIGTVAVQGGTVNGVVGKHTLQIGSSTALGANNVLNLSDGGQLDVNGTAVVLSSLTGTTGSAITNTAAATSLTVQGSSSTTMSGEISGNLALVKNGSSTLTLGGNNQQTGAIAVNQGALKLGSNSALGTSSNAVTVASGAALDTAGFSSKNTISIAGGGGNGLGALHNSTVQKSEIERVNLAANARVSGTGRFSQISIFNLDLGGNTLTIQNARVNLGGDSSISNGDITLLPPNDYFAPLQSTQIYSTGYQSGAGSTGNITLGKDTEWGVNNYDNSGTTNRKTVTLDGGRISTGSNTIGTSNNGGHLQSFIANDIIVTANGGRILGSNYGYSLKLGFSGKLSGSGNISILGTEGVVFTGDTSAYTGDLSLSTTFQFGTYIADNTFNGTMSNGVGAHSFEKLGSRKLTITKNNTFSGPTSVKAGTLQVGNGGTAGNLGTGAVSIDTGAQLSINRSNAFTLANAISGAGNISIEGTGVTTFSGNNSYTGTTTVKSGQLVAGANNAFGSGNLYVQTGATLNTGFTGAGKTVANTIFLSSGATVMGAGTLTNSINVVAGAAINPGNSPGQLTLANGGSFAANSTYNWEVTGTGDTAGSDFDQIILSGGTLSIADGAIFKIQGDALDYTAAYWDSSRSFDVLTKSGTSTIAGAFTLDTASAGNFTNEGTWSLIAGDNGQQAIWTAVPEPSATLLISLAALTFSLRRKRA